MSGKSVKGRYRRGPLYFFGIHCLLALFQPPSLREISIRGRLALRCFPIASMA